jgi:hypothetical protein
MAYDPLQYEPDLPIERPYYPLGYPLQLATNSEEVLDAGTESWGAYPQLHGTEPMRLRVLVEPDEEPPTPPVYRGQEHLLLIAGGKANAAVCDYTRRFAYCRLSKTAVADRAFASYYYLEAMAFHLLTQWHVAPVHCACVVLDGVGVALCGESGAGKTSLAYACAMRGWTYVSDNESWLVRDEVEPLLIGNPSRIRFRESAAALFPELRHFTPALHANGKMSIDFRTAGASDLKTQISTRVGFVVFLERQTSGRAGLMEMPRGRAFEQLLGGVPIYEPHIRRQHEDALRRLTELPVMSLRYSSLESGAAQLEKLVRSQ